MTRRHTRLLAAASILLLTGAAGFGGWFVLLRAGPLQRAEAFSAAGDLRNAQVELRNALKARPNDADVHLRMAQLQMKLADPVAAQKEFRAAAALGADRWTIVPLLGEAMLAQGLNEETLAQVPARGPTPELAARNLLIRAVAQIGLKDLRAAGETLQAALALAPNQVQVPLIEARIAAANNDLALTNAKLDEVLRRDPGQIDALIMKERLLSAAGASAEALALAERAVQSAPWSPMARMNRAADLMTAGQDARAQADVNFVLESQPRFTEAIYLNAVLMSRRDRLADAASELQKLETFAPRLPQILFTQAVVAMRLGRAQSAAEAARRYVSLSPADPAGIRLLAQTELDAKRPAAALAALQRAPNATDGPTLDLLGRVLTALGDEPAALQAFGRAAGAAPDDAAILQHLGLSQMQQGDSAAATATLDRSFSLQPSLLAAGEALVIAALNTGDMEQAEAALGRLRSSAGSSEGVGVLTGMVRMRRGDLDGAQVALTAALRAFPGSVDARLMLARVMAGQGRRPAALTLLGELAAREPANMRVLNAYLPLMLQDNQVPGAIQALEAARAADPKQLAFTAMLADAFTILGTPERALPLLRPARAGELIPVVLLPPRARAQEKAGDAEAAKASWREVLEAQPADLVARSSLVDLLLRRREYDPAEAVLRDGLRTVPGNFRLMSSLLALQVPTKGLSAAMATAAELRGVPANMPMAAVLKGDLLMKAKRPADAGEAFAAELDAAPSELLLMRTVGALAEAGDDGKASERLRRWLAQVPDAVAPAQALAQLDIKAGRLDDAKAHLAVVLARRPDDPLALNNLAGVYARTADARALATAQRAYIALPGADAADTLGWIMTQDGNAKAAIPLLRKASGLRPADPAIRYHLAAALAQEGEAGEAASLLQPLSAASFEEQQAAQALLAKLKL